MTIRLSEEHELSVPDIYYIHHVSGNCIVYEQGREPYMFYLPFGELLDQLKDYEEFLLVNPSTIVNLRMIEKVLKDSRLLLMKNGHYVQIARSKRLVFLRTYNQIRK